MRTLLRIIISALASMILVGTGMTANAAAPQSETSAVVQPQSAFGSTPIGSFSYSVGGATIKVPAGCFLDHKINGEQNRISEDFAGVDCVGLAAAHPGLFCNYYFKFIYKKADETAYASYTSPRYSGCQTTISTVYSTYVPRTLPYYGYGCVEFYTGGSKRAQQCHAITKN